MGKPWATHLVYWLLALVGGGRDNGAVRQSAVPSRRPIAQADRAGRSRVAAAHGRRSPSVGWIGSPSQRRDQDTGRQRRRRHRVGRATPILWRILALVTCTM